VLPTKAPQQPIKQHLRKRITGVAAAITHCLRHHQQHQQMTFGISCWSLTPQQIQTISDYQLFPKQIN
jgi:hypothetical protein